MILARIAAIASAAALLIGCESVPQARASKLASEPNAAQTKAIELAVQKAMGRIDIVMDPGRLVDTSSLRVMPKAIPGITDRIPGTPTEFTLMSTGERCYLLEAGGGMRVELPDLPCL